MNTVNQKMVLEPIDVPDRPLSSRALEQIIHGCNQFLRKRNLPVYSYGEVAKMEVRKIFAKRKKFV